MRSLILFASCLAAVAASPVLQDHDANYHTTTTTTTTAPTAAAKSPATSDFCSIVDKLVTGRGYQTAATKFCSSYLSIPGSTISTTTTVASGGSTTTATVTVATQTVPGSVTTTTTTIVTTNTHTDVSTSTSTVTNTQITTTTVAGICSYPYLPQQKRGAPQPKPACFSPYSGGVLSSACSCLSIPPSATITTITKTTPGAVVTKTSSVTVTVTTQSTSTITDTSSTDTTTTMTTVTTVSTDTTTTSTVTSGIATPSSFYVYNFNTEAFGFLFNTNVYFDGVTSRSEATVFTYDDQLQGLVNGDTYAAYVVGQDPALIEFDTLATINDSSDTLEQLACSLNTNSGDDDPCVLTCALATGGDISSLDQNGMWYVASSLEGPGGRYGYFPIYVIDTQS